MQTFLPHWDFERSARDLDAKRLGKQRVECIQVVRALTRETYGWRNHPAVRMWRGHEEALGRYSITVCDVWLERGFGDTCAATIGSDLAAAGVTSFRSQQELAEAGLLPPWLGDEGFHLSHRSALVRKDPDHYRPLYPDVPDDLPYFWPVPKPEVPAVPVAEDDGAVEVAADGAGEDALGGGGDAVPADGRSTGAAGSLR